MFIRSTGLGRTLLSGRIARIVNTDVVPSTLEPPNGAAEPMRLLVEMEITNPVHWTVRAFIDPSDLREMLKIIFTNPALLLSCLKFLFSRGPNYAEPAPAKTPPTTTAAPAPMAAAPASAVSGMAPIGPRPIPARKK